MSEHYDIRFYQDDLRFYQDDRWAVYPKGDYESKPLFVGTLVEIDAWLSLKGKGFDV